MKNNFFIAAFIFIGLLFQSQFTFSQNKWSITHVDKNGDGSVEIKVDALGNDVHILVKGSFDNLFYYYSNNKGKTFTKKDMGKIKHRTFEVGEIAAFIDKKSVYNIAYFAYNGDIVHATKNQNQTWNYDTLLKWKNYDQDPWHRILVDCDEQNNLYAFFKDRKTYKLFYKNGSDWLTNQVLITQTNTDEFTFDVDKKGVAHILFNSYKGELHHYFSTDKGQSWQYEFVGNFNADGKLAMKTDSKGNLHIAFVQDDGKFNGKNIVEGCTYVSKINGTYQSKAIEFLQRTDDKINDLSTYYQHIPSIDIDVADGVHIAYLPGEDHDFEFPLGDTIVYAYKPANKSDFTFQGVPLKDEFYPGVNIRVTNGNIYYAYIGSTDGTGNSSGIELAYRPFNPDTTSTNDANKEIQIQGELLVLTDTIKVEFWDNGEEDGDVLNLFLNGNPLQLNINLTNAHQQLLFTLNENGEYILSFDAVSEGLYPPCTAVITIDDGKEVSTFTITSDLNSSGSIKLVKQ